MPTVQVPLTPEAAAALHELARRELRPPRLKAALLVIEGLRRAGFDPIEERELAAERHDR